MNAERELRIPLDVGLRYSIAVLAAMLSLAEPVAERICHPPENVELQCRSFRGSTLAAHVGNCELDKNVGPHIEPEGLQLSMPYSATGNVNVSTGGTAVPDGVQINQIS